jgi:hypothetical protein
MSPACRIPRVLIPGDQTKIDPIAGRGQAGSLAHPTGSEGPSFLSSAKSCS